MSAREVTLLGGSPWGFRMHGGHDLHQPLRISRVNPGSKAAQQGVREGDLISSINGKSTRELTNSESHALLRNAGDHLKLGLNQESGSPKRRIYKSSLQESSSTETLKKTTKSFTSNTRIIAAESEKNGVDDTNTEQNHVNQNGGLKSLSPDQPTDTAKKSPKISNEIQEVIGNQKPIDSAEYHTVVEVSNTKMPCGSRNRRNRRNRNRKRFQRPLSPPEESSAREDIEEDDLSDRTEKSFDENDTRQEVENSSDSGKGEDLAEANINGSAVKVTTESLPCQGNMSITRWRPRRNKFKLEKKVLDTGTKICEITTIRNFPMEAKLDHIPGVGILESGQQRPEDSKMTVSEPLERVEPLSSSVTNKVEILGDRQFSLAILADKGHSLEIHEVSDSDIETDNSRHAIVVEAESDVERDLLSERSTSEESSFEKREDEDELGEATMSREDEQKLRNFLEGLQLPSTSFLREGEAGSSQRKVKKRPALESYASQTLETKRSLEIIEEEGDKSSEDDEQSIRDFINEEIGKYRRDDNRKRRKLDEEDDSESLVKGITVPKIVETTNEKSCLDFEKLSNEPGNFSEFVKEPKCEEFLEEITPKDPENFRDVPKNFNNEHLQLLKENNFRFENSSISRNFGDVPKGIRLDEQEAPQEICFEKSTDFRELILKESDDCKQQLPTETNYCEGGKFPVQETIEDLKLVRPPINFNNPHGLNSLFYPRDNYSRIYDPRYHRPVQIFTSLIQDNIVNDMYGSERPPTPPKRTVSFDSEPDRPPAPPEVDYPFYLPEVPPLPVRLHNFKRVPPDPPTRRKPMYYQNKRSSSTKSYCQRYYPEPSSPDHNLGFNEDSSQNDFLNESVSPNHNGSFNKPNYYFLYQQPSLVDHHERVLNAYKTSDFTEQKTLDFVRTLLTVLSNHETSRQDVQDVLLSFDLKQLPANIREIIDDLMAPSLSGSIESDSVTNLCNDGKFGSDSSLEIAHDLVHDATLEKYTEFSHSTTPCPNVNERPSEPEHPSIKKDCASDVESYSLQKDQCQSLDLNGKSVSHDTNETIDLTSENFKQRSVTFGDKLSNEIEGKGIKEIDKVLDELDADSGSLSPDFHGQDSTSSSATPSTAKYNPKRSSLDIEDIENEEERKEEKKSPQPKRKLALLKNSGESIKEGAESPQPIPYSPVEDLYFVPLNDNEKDLKPNRPDLLRDLCIKKILSLPYGFQIINEITLPKFNIFKNLNNIYEHLEQYSDLGFPNDKTDFDTNMHRPKSWIGVPTTENPHLLVCLSPSQQESDIRKDADKLLDLHTKFINRRSYWDQQPQKVSPLKYKMDLTPRKINFDQSNGDYDSFNYSPSFGNHKDDDKSANRLLNIIKENPVSRPKISNDSQERLRVTRLSDWLNLARRDSADISHWTPTCASGELLIESTESKHNSDKEHNVIQQISCSTQSKVGGLPKSHGNNDTTNDDILKEVIFENGVVKRLGDASHYVNSALIIKSPETPGSPARSITPLPKSPISMNSAIIDKSPNVTEENKTPVNFKKNFDLRQNVNTALIDDKPQIPRRIKKVVTVDRSCIDTTSIFDQSPPRRHLEGRKYQNLESVKRVTAAEIMENLKQLQESMKEQLQGRKRYSLPQEYFDKQLRYIELLESELRNVLLSEEEEGFFVEKKDDGVEKKDNGAIVENIGPTIKDNGPKVVDSGLMVIDSGPKLVDNGPKLVDNSVDKVCDGAKKEEYSGGTVNESVKKAKDSGEISKSDSIVDDVEEDNQIISCTKDNPKNFDNDVDGKKKDLDNVRTSDERIIHNTINANQLSTNGNKQTNQTNNNSNNNTIESVCNQENIISVFKNDEDDVCNDQKNTEKVNNTGNNVDGDNSAKNIPVNERNINPIDDNQKDIVNNADPMENNLVYSADTDLVNNTDSTKKDIGSQDTTNVTDNYNINNNNGISCKNIDNTESSKQQQTNKDLDYITHKESWHEEVNSRNKSDSDLIKVEGSRESSRKLSNIDGGCEETIREKLLKEQSHTMSTNSENCQSSISTEIREEVLKEDKTEVHFETKICKERPKSIASAVPTNGEVFRKQMYDEYVHKVLEREERKHHKVVKISSHQDLQTVDKSDEGNMSLVEKEFIAKAKNRMSKFGIQLDDSDSLNYSSETISDLGEKEEEDLTKARCLVDGREVKDARSLPKHLQEFLQLSTEIPDEEDDGVWSPGSEPPPPPKQPNSDRNKDEKDSGIPPVWTPSSAGPSPVPERKEFRPVSFESPVLSRKNINVKKEEASPPWESDAQRKEASNAFSQNNTSRIVNSHSAPPQGLNTLAGAPRLPRAQNPTITLLQKAREGQLPKGAAYLDECQSTPRIKSDEKPLTSPGEIIYNLKKEYESEPEMDTIPRKKIVDLGPRKIEGIGPTTREGVPLVLRSEVKEDNQAKWYKRMYDSLHRADNDDDYITIRYKPRRGARYGYGGSTSGYLSEPEPRVYSDRSSTYDNRRRVRNKENDFTTSTMPKKSAALKYSSDTYKNQPGRIEDYIPGKSSIAEKETKEWWDEVMDIFDGWLDENGQPNGQHLGKTASRSMSLSYRSADCYNVRLPNLSSYTKSREIGSGFRARELKRENGSRYRFEDFDNLEPHPKFDKIRSNIARGRPKSIFPDKKIFGSLGSLGLEFGNKRNTRNETFSEIKSKIKTDDDKSKTKVIKSLDDCSDRIIRPLDQPESKHVGLLEGKSKSFVLPDRCSPRSVSLNGSQSRIEDRSQKLPSPRNHHNHHHHQRTNPFCTSSSTNHITLLTPSPPSSTALMSPSRPFDQRNSHSSKPYMSHALKESGYESDSTLIFRRREDVNSLSPLSPLEQRIAYKTVQKGGDVPLHGLRKLAPERPKDDTEIEYFPISPTLTRIRVHRKSPVSSPPKSSMTFVRYKRTAPSMATISSKKSTPEFHSLPGKQQIKLSSLRGRPASRVTSPLRPPSPPTRQSSRNNPTLQLYSKFATSQTPKHRHEQCFIADKVSSIRLLRERLSSNLEKHKKDREEAQKFKTIRAASSSPCSRARVLSPDSVRLKPEICLSRSLDRLRPRVTSSLREPQEKIFLPKKLCLGSKNPVKAIPTCQHNGAKHLSPVKKDIRRTKKEQEESCRRLSRSTLDLSEAKKPLLKNYKLSHSQEVRRESSKDGHRSSRTETKEVLITRGPRDSAIPSQRYCSREGRRDISREGQRYISRERSVPKEGQRLSPKESQRFISREDQRYISKEGQGYILKESQRYISRERLADSPKVGVKDSSKNQRENSKHQKNSVVGQPKKQSENQVKAKESDKPIRIVSKTSTTVISVNQPGIKERAKEFKDKFLKTAIASKEKEVLKSEESLHSSKLSSPSSSPISLRRALLESPETKQLERESSLSLSSISKTTSSDTSRRKKHRDKPQTILRTPTTRPLARLVNSDEKQISKTMKDRDSKPRNLTKKDSAKSKVKKFSKKDNFEDEIPALTVEQIRKHQEATRSETFFQSLFLRNISPTPSQTSTLRRSAVQEKARIFQEHQAESFKSEPSLRSLSIYLSNKRPVSDSRFKNWERESLSSRCSSPRGVSWNGRSIFQKVRKFDSLLGSDEFGSSTSLRGRSPELIRDIKERSLSEPPLKILPEQNSSRSVSPSPTRSPSSRKIRSLKQDRTEDSRSDLAQKVRARSASDAEECRHKKVIFGSNFSLAKSTSSLNTLPSDREDYHQYILEMLHCKKKSSRYKDLYDFYASLEKMGELEKTTSTGDLRPRMKNEEIIDYDRWKEVRAKEKAHQELKVLYGKLKNVQMEKDFLFSTKDVDRCKWRGDSGLRLKERSVENIREQFRKLANEESELEALRQREIASKKDVYKPLWRGNSVVNVANTMTKKAADKTDSDKSSVSSTLQKSLGGSKKFWSSLSVEQVNILKNQLNEIYGTDSPKSKSTLSSQSPIPKEKPEGAQLNLSKKYEIVVPSETSREDGKKLHVRCHSMIVDKEDPETPPKKRSISISRVRSLERSQSDRVVPSSMSEIEKKRLSLTLSKEVLDKVQKGSISPKETRGAIAASMPTKKSTRNPSPSSLEKFPAEKKKPKKNDFVLVLTPNNGSAENIQRVENVLDEWSKKPPILAMSVADSLKVLPSGSELDSATESSEASVRTVVHKLDSDEVPRKIEFFEKIESKDSKDHKELSRNYREMTKNKLSSSQSFADLKELFGEIESTRYTGLPLGDIRSRSTSPRRGGINIRGRSPSASPDTNTRQLHACLRDREYERPRSVSPYLAGASTNSSCSLESLWHRSTSPDPDRYWRTYLKLVRNGSVRRLRQKFESLEDLSHGRSKLIFTKRYQSDPELTRNLLKKVTDASKSYIKPQEIPDVAWLRRKYEPVRGRARRRGSSPPIPRVPLRLEDLSMPHINVISKMAELKDSSNVETSNSIARKEETKELKAKRPVGRVRDKFEKSVKSSKTSILGEMFTLTPSVHELRDIAPYLAGRWVAHKYPSRRDNARSLSSPPDLESAERVQGKEAAFSDTSSITPPRRRKRFEKPRATSSSPVRPRTPVSILKQPHEDIFANQPFDPSKHRPKFRYQPPPPPPSPTFRRESRPWWPPMPTYTARPTVTFEGPAFL